jgi:RHS repeat-associated protein
VRDVANTSGTVIDHVAYDSYGNVTSETNATNGDRFKFDGMAWDTAIGLYYDNARWYDPTDGRFASQDSIGFAAGDANLYRFVKNGPTNATDPTGHQIAGGIIDGVRERWKNRRQIIRKAIKDARKKAIETTIKEIDKLVNKPRKSFLEHSQLGHHRKMLKMHFGFPIGGGLLGGGIGIGGHGTLDIGIHFNRDF